MAPRRRGRRPRRGGRLPALKYEFAHILNVNAGVTDKAVTYADLGIDSSRPCRVRSVRVNICTSNASAASMALGVFGPRVSTGDSLRSIVNRSRVLSIGASPRTISVSSPRVTDYATPEISDVVFRYEIYGAQPGTGSVTHLMVSGEVTMEFLPRSLPVVLKA